MANRHRAAGKNTFAKWQADADAGGTEVPLIAHIRSYRSDDREGTNIMNQPDNLPLLVKLRDAIVNHRWLAKYPVVAELVVDTDDNRGFHCFLIRIGYNNAGYQLGIDIGDSEPSSVTYGKIFSRHLKKFPGVQVTRVSRVEQGLNVKGPGSAWSNSEVVKITTTLNYDVFNDVDFLHKLQCIEDSTKSNAVVKKINKLIQKYGVEKLQEFPRLGQELI